MGTYIDAGGWTATPTTYVRDLRGRSRRRRSTGRSRPNHSPGKGARRLPFLGFYIPSRPATTLIGHAALLFAVTIGIHAAADRIRTYGGSRISRLPERTPMMMRIRTAKQRCPIFMKCRPKRPGGVVSATGRFLSWAAILTHVTVCGLRRRAQMVGLVREFTTARRMLSFVQRMPARPKDGRSNHVDRSGPAARRTIGELRALSRFSFGTRDCVGPVVLPSVSRRGDSAAFEFYPSVQVPAVPRTRWDAVFADGFGIQERTMALLGRCISVTQDGFYVRDLDDGGAGVCG